LSDWVSTTSYVYVFFRIEFLVSTVIVENFMAFMSGIRSRFLHVLKSYSCKLDILQYSCISGFETINWCITWDLKKPSSLTLTFLGFLADFFMLEKKPRHTYKGLETKRKEWTPQPGPSSDDTAFT